MDEGLRRPHNHLPTIQIVENGFSLLFQYLELPKGPGIKPGLFYFYARCVGKKEPRGLGGVISE